MNTTNSVTIGGVKLVIGNDASKEVGKEIGAQNIDRVLLVTDRGIASLGLHRKAMESLEKNHISCVIFDQVPGDPPEETVEKGTELIKKEKCGGVLAIGGGSVMDAAKAMNIMCFHEGRILDYDNSPGGGKRFHRPGYPLFCVPTTAGTGSEVTQYAVITSSRENRKATVGDPMLLSKAAFLDPLLTVGLPQQITASTGIDAMAHAIEAYTSCRVLGAPGSSVFSDTYALQAVRLLSSGLRRACADGADLEARKKVMLGATMAGFVTQAGSGAAHGMGTPLGAHYHVPHGQAVGMMLPCVMKWNIEACPERLRDIACAMGCHTEGMDTVTAAGEAVKEMQSLLKEIRFPKLSDYVTEKEELRLLAEEAMKDKCCSLNARRLNMDDALALYEEAGK